MAGSQTQTNSIPNPTGRPFSFHVPVPLTLNSPMFAFASTDDQRRLIWDAQVLRILASNPSSVLPHSKSLASIFAEAVTPIESVETADDATLKAASQTPPSLENRVSEIANNAFWDEALEKFSSSKPTIVIDRIQHLYTDIHLSLEAIFPSSHSLMVVFSSPLSPTSSPLRSALRHVSGLIEALKERCAPARDEEADRALAIVNEPSNSMAQRIVDGTRATLALIKHMKQDLRSFSLANFRGEEDLRVLVAREAKAREREAVATLYSPTETAGLSDTSDDEMPARNGRKKFSTTKPSISIGTIKDSWKHWTLDPVEPFHPKLWTNLVVDALTQPIPVSLTPPPATLLPSTISEPPENRLPPLFLLSLTSLFTLQNILQALVLTAALLAVLPVPEGPAKDDFVRRVWTLLRSEATSSTEEDVGLTEHDDEAVKLINLEDEAVNAVLLQPRAQQADGTSKGLESHIDSTRQHRETEIREHVRRIARTEDPVYKLLMSRLKVFLQNTLTRPSTAATPPGVMTNSLAVPLTLRTGRSLLPIQTQPKQDGSERVVHPPKGFEHAIMKEGIGEICDHLMDTISWIRWVWADLVG